MTGVCVDCGKKIPKGDNCCEECFNAPPKTLPGTDLVRETVTQTCKQCGRKFAGSQWKGGSKLTKGLCSEDCTHAYMKEHYTKTVHCVWCATSFQAHHSKQYCSDTCRVAAHRAGKKPNGRSPAAPHPPLLKLRFNILERDGFRCRYCGRSADDGTELHVDHVHPKSKNGEWHEDNLLTACRECNLGKGDRILKTRAPVSL